MGKFEAVASPDEVHLVVGGYHYYLDADDLLEHPESYFAHLLKDEWNKDKTAAVTIDRNGKVFCYIHYYLFSGYMDPQRKRIVDLDLLLSLRTEADFYGLDGLVSLCDDRIQNSMCRTFSSRKNIGLDSFCVRANEEKATDALVVAMDIFRPATVATARLESYKLDLLQSYYESVPALLRSERINPYSTIYNCSFAHKCVMVSESSFSEETISKMHNAFSKWPRKMGCQVARVLMDPPQVYVYETEGYSASRVAISLTRGDIHGVFLYIFNSEHTGGRITTKVNGEKVSIEKPGECMALLPGCSYSVETVTSGTLVLFKCPVSSYPYPDYESETHSDGGDQGGDRAVDGDVTVADEVNNVPNGSGGGGGHAAADTGEGDSAAASEQAPLVWQVHGSFSTEITPERSDALTQAINTALETYAGVVICLSTYYPAGHSTNTARRCETDPALLERFDEKLFTQLSNFYEVTPVTVAINTEEVNEGSTARVLDFSQDADMHLKVVAPMQSVSLDRGKTKTTQLKNISTFYGVHV
eukprot:gene16918-19282_t